MTSSRRHDPNRRARAWLAALMSSAGLAAGTMPAHAIVLSEAGGTATLSGTIEPGDGAKFKAFLEAGRPERIRTLYLHSHGGKVLEGIAIGRLVRQAGISTAVDASNTFCDSACTLVFTAGVRRFYVHGERVFEGTSGRTGLGFHPAHRPGDRFNQPTLNDRGTDNIRGFYAEMGVPKAGALIDRAAFNTFFRPSGQTALDLGIATSLGAP